MSKILGRMKNLFRRDSRPQNLPPGSYPNPVGNAETLGTITKTPYQMDDDDNEDTESLRNYNVPEQTRLKTRPTDFNQPDINSSNSRSYGTPSPGPMNPPNPQPRGRPMNFRPNMPMNNNNVRPPFGPNIPSNPPSRPGFPFPPQNQGGFPPSGPNNMRPPFGGFPPGINPNQSVPPSNAPPSTGGGLPSSLNSSPIPLNNPQSSSIGFLPGIDSNERSTVLPPSSNNTQSPLNQSFQGTNDNQMTRSTPFGNLLSVGNSQTTVPPSNIPNNELNNRIDTQQDVTLKSRSPFRKSSIDNEENQSRLELDYPIENVLIDANIPSAIAIKINDVVEKDRLGNAYHVHRYTFEPSGPQHISFNNNTNNNNPSVINNSFRGGTRHIREIHKNHRTSSSDNRSHPHRSARRSHRPHDHYSSTTTLEQYIDQLLRTPGSTVIHAENSNDLQQILNQHLFYPQVSPPQPSYLSFPSDINSFNEFTGPVFYYTARALYDDPMRRY